MTRNQYEYKTYWSNIGYVLTYFFDEEDAYIFFAYIMDVIFPKVTLNFKI